MPLSDAKGEFGPKEAESQAEEVRIQQAGGR